MYLEIDPDKLTDIQEQRDCKKAISYLENHESRILEALSAYHTLEGKIQFLMEIKISRERDLRNFPIEFSYAGMTPVGFLTKEIGIEHRTRLSEGEGKWICKISIAWLAKIIREMSEEKEPEPSGIEAQSLPSTPFQVLIIHYLLLHGQYEMLGTQKATLIQSLTGKNYKNVYKSVLKPTQTPTDELRTKELIAVRDLFQSVGLGEIAKLISSDLQ